MKSSIPMTFGEKTQQDFSFSETYEMGRYRCDAHWHDCFEILYVRSNSLSVVLSDKAISLSEGDVLIIPPRTIHGTECEKGITDFWCFGYTEKLIYSTDISFVNMKYVSPFYSVSDMRELLLQKGSAASEYFLKLLQEAMQLYNEVSFTRELVVRAKILEIHAMVFSLYFENKKNLRLENEYLFKTEAYIEEHISEDISPYDIAKELHISYSHLARVIRDTCGYSIGELIIRIKLNYAERLMSEAYCAKITEVAGSVGFKSASYFAKCFRRVKGVSPRRYRKMLMN